MAEQNSGTLSRLVSRRTAIAGTLAAGAGVIAYSTLGGQLSDGEHADSAVARSDTDAIASESVRISHLLRRAGFGASRDEHERYQTLGLQRSIDELVNYREVDDSEALALAEQTPVDPQNRASAALWWLARMANTRRPLQEKMTLFWHGLLTSQMSVVRSPQAMARQNEFLREHAFDTFPAILRGISMDPAMMTYLDLDGSRATAPNENYARELMELFALGEGNYSEQDVREAARAFTGWQVPRVRLEGNAFTLEEPVFRPGQFDRGDKHFLDKSGNFRPEDVVDIITQRPESAEHIVGKLFAFFVYGNPAPADLQPFIDVYLQNDRRIGPVVEAILRSDIFYSPRAYRALVKSPIEYAVGAVKALGANELLSQYFSGPGGRAAGGVLAQMGQVPFEPPNVSGWRGGSTWLNSSTLLARLNFVNLLVGGAPAPVRGAKARPKRQTAEPVDVTSGEQTDTVADAIDYYLPLLLDDNVADEWRQVLIDYGGGPDAPIEPDKLRGLAYLVLASPQFHLS